MEVSLTGTAIRVNKLKEEIFSAPIGDLFSQTNVIHQSRARKFLCSCMLIAALVAFSISSSTKNDAITTIQTHEEHFGNLMQKVDALCTDSDASACAALLNQIEPCGALVQRAGSEDIAFNAEKITSPGCVLE